VHLALSGEADVETESEGDGFMKRVEVRLKR
jgi:predicted RNA-binding protein Jag